MYCRKLWMRFWKQIMKRRITFFFAKNVRVLRLPYNVKKLQNFVRFNQTRLNKRWHCKAILNRSQECVTPVVLPYLCMTLYFIESGYQATIYLTKCREIKQTIICILPNICIIVGWVQDKTGQHVIDWLLVVYRIAGKYFMYIHMGWE